MVTLDLKIYSVICICPLPDVITTFLWTATSLSVTWTQPNFSFTVDDYVLSLARATGNEQRLCNSFMDTRSVTTAPNDTTRMFTGLQEFSSYTLSLVATFEVYDQSRAVPMSSAFNTFSACTEKFLKN